MGNFSNFSNEFRFSLASNKIPKINCPYCGAKKHWQRYIDLNTKEPLPEQYGKCDNMNKCGEWNDPHKDGFIKKILEYEQKVTKVTKSTIEKKSFFIHKTRPQPGLVYFNNDTFIKTLNNYDKNVFIQNLLTRVKFPFDIDDVVSVIKLYRLGTISRGNRAGAITFPFIDINGNIRTIQVKEFDQDNHTTGQDFLHSMIEKSHNWKNKVLPEWLKNYIAQDKKVSCLFGEHLLKKYPNNPVALVEAPKTSVYGTLYFGLPESPEDLIWLSVGAKGYLNYEKIKVLQGRFIYVFPDLSKDGITFKEWESKLNEYEQRLPGTRFIFYDLLERISTQSDKISGNDIADYLIKFDWRRFRDQLRETAKNKIEPPTPMSTQKEDIKTLVRKKPEKKERLFDLLDLKPLNYVRAFTDYELRTRPGLKYVKGNYFNQKREDWTNEITELENFFNNFDLPKTIQVNRFCFIEDVREFIKSHMEVVKYNNGKQTFRAYLDHLQELQQVLEVNKMETPKMFKIAL